VNSDIAEQILVLCLGLGESCGHSPVEEEDLLAQQKDVRTA
jgi:hypothetical protein